MSKLIESIPFNEETDKFVPAALRWLFEIEAVNSTAVSNVLIINIYSSSPNIKDVEFLMDKAQKKMLIWLKFNWKANLFKKIKENTSNSILNSLEELLPNFEFRITENRDIFDIALEKSKVIKDSKNIGDNNE